MPSNSRSLSGLEPSRIESNMNPNGSVGYLKDRDILAMNLDNNNNNNNSQNSNNMSRNSSVASGKSLLGPKLSWKTKFFYSLGHVYNDLTVSIWFSYTLLFFKFQFTGTMAGTLILIGQIADAIASPFVGYESDKSANLWICRKYGRRKTWHLLGVIMNTISVPFVYNRCFSCDDSSEWSRFIYYGMLIVIFQAGWAATQVSHVSLITDLTSDTNERIELNAYRQAATIAANICLYTVTLFVIGFNDDSTLKEEDLVIFTKVSYIVCAIGLVFAALFHIFVHEPDHVPKPRQVRPSVFTVETKKYLQNSRGSQGIITLLANKKDEPAPGRLSISYLSDPEAFEEHLRQKKISEKKWYHWFQSFSFWKITLMYTFARMFVNITQVYTSLYLQYYLLLPKRTLAIIPFATYFAGLIFSFASKPLSARFGSRMILVIGSIFGVLTSVWVLFGQNYNYKTYEIYLAFAFLGIGGTALLISSLALTSDLIGGNTSTGAFVFAAMSFFDKSINGLVIAVLEQVKPAESKATTAEAEPIVFYRNIMVLLTGAPSIFIFLCLFTIVRTNYGRRSRANSTASAIIH